MGIDMARDANEIRVLTFNGEHDFGGHTTEAWKAVYGWIADDIRPDIMLLQEASHARKDGRRGLYAAMHRLGMTGFLAETSTVESPNPPAILVNPAKIRIVARYPQPTGRWHEPAQCRITRADREDGPEVSLASVHLCARSATLRLQEAELMPHWGQVGQVDNPDDPDGPRLQWTVPCIIGGDFNSYSSSAHELAPLPDLTNTADRNHRAHRTLPDRRTPDTQPWDTLTAAGFRDLALFAYLHRGQGEQAMQGTSHGRTDQGIDPARGQRPPRIDFTFANGSLPGALRSSHVIEDPNRHSDHKSLLNVFEAEPFWEAAQAMLTPHLPV
ncbi:hypothetical protein ACIQF6_28255 [Kitasatospora sp. NPDC092948]|uniref:hypothetical protein n=1 Tax=Kitasatospora sp. NPDC092948 TaxID=3364088 RepID=UPI0037F5B5D0